MDFKKIRPTRASTIIAQQLLKAIKDGYFPIGSKLPSESELANKMDVSRPSIREGLSALAAVGLIESKPGSGNYVRNPTDSIGQEALLILENESSCIEIMEARFLLEPPVAVLAATHRTSEDLSKLHQLCERMKQLARKGDFAPYFDVDEKFHHAIVAAAGNVLLARVFSPLINTMEQKLYREFTHDYYLSDQLSLESTALLHEEILQAIEEEDEEGTVAKMRDHWKRMLDVAAV